MAISVTSLRRLLQSCGRSRCCTARASGNPLELGCFHRPQLVAMTSFGAGGPNGGFRPRLCKNVSSVIIGETMLRGGGLSRMILSPEKHSNAGWGKLF